MNSSIDKISLKTFVDNNAFYCTRYNKLNHKNKGLLLKRYNNVSILDLKKSLPYYKVIWDYVYKMRSQKKTFIIVSTVKDHSDSIISFSNSINVPYVIKKWNSGLLTNWSVISKQISKLIELETFDPNEGVNKFLKKSEVTAIYKKRDKLYDKFNGIRDMKKVPDVIIIVDIIHDNTALREANRLNIPVISMLDLDCDVDKIQFPFPSNNNSIKTIELFFKFIEDSIRLADYHSSISKISSKEENGK